MRKILLASSSIAATLLGAAAANAADAAPTHLAPMTFLAGSCWSGPQTKTSTDTHCYAWKMGGRILVDTHIVRGSGPDYCGQTVYHWDANAKQIVYRYWAADGGVSNGSVQEVSAGKLSYPDETYTDLSGNSLKLKSYWEQTGKDKIVAVLEQSTDAGWQEIARNNLERVTSHDQGHEIHESIANCLK